MTLETETLVQLKKTLEPKFKVYAERHEGERPCVEDLLDVLIELSKKTVRNNGADRLSFAGYGRGTKKLSSAAEWVGALFYGEPGFDFHFEAKPINPYTNEDWVRKIKAIQDEAIAAVSK